MSKFGVRHRTAHIREKVSLDNYYNTGLIEHIVAIRRYAMESSTHLGYTLNAALP